MTSENNRTLERYPKPSDTDTSTNPTRDSGLEEPKQENPSRRAPSQVDEPGSGGGEEPWQVEKRRA